MYFHNVILSIYGFVQKKAYEEGLSLDIYHSVKEIRLKAAREVGRLAKVHQDLWGIDRIPPSNIQACSISERTLLEDIDNPVSRKAFIELCIMSKAAARRWPLGKGMMRALQGAAKELAIHLPSEIDALFADIDSSWSSRDKDHIRGTYTNSAVYLKSNLSNEAELDTFLEKWDALRFANRRLGLIAQRSLQVFSVIFYS
jgi:hypothetical protein